MTAYLGGGDLRLGGGDGERPLPGDATLLRGGVSPRRRRGGESARRRGGESGSRLGDPPLRAIGDLLRGESRGFRRGEAEIKVKDYLLVLLTKQEKCMHILCSKHISHI